MTDPSFSRGSHGRHSAAVPGYKTRSFAATKVWGNPIRVVDEDDDHATEEITIDRLILRAINESETE